MVCDTSQSGTGKVRFTTFTNGQMAIEIWPDTEGEDCPADYIVWGKGDGTPREVKSVRIMHHAHWQIDRTGHNMEIAAVPYYPTNECKVVQEFFGEHDETCPCEVT